MKLESTLPMFILPALIIAASIVQLPQYLSTDVIHMDSNIIAYADLCTKYDELCISRTGL